MRVAVVEFNHYHDEVLPTVVRSLNQLGSKPDVYVPVRAAKKNAFALAPGLRFRQRLIDGPGPIGDLAARIRGTPARRERYDVLIMNSLEPPSVIQSASRILMPTLAIVHNANLLQEDRAHRQFFAGPLRQPMVLGRHVALSLEPEQARNWIAPFYFGDLARVPVAGPEPKRLCVQGNVEYTRRDYFAFVDAIAVLASQRSDFLVRNCGAIRLARWDASARTGRSSGTHRPIRIQRR